MSKFILPTQKGTETFPAVMKAPTAVRIHGVEPHSEAARVLTSRFAAHINHFHVSQAQKYSLSTVENYRAHATYPGLKMTYTNLQGHETIDIVVADEVLEEEKKRQVKISPDFGVVDIVVQDSAMIECRFEATLLRPAVPRDEWQLNRSPNPFRGVEYDDGLDFDYSDGVYNLAPAWGSTAIIQLCDSHATTGAISGIPNRVSSLLVDFRPLGPTQPVTVDLYAWMEQGPTTYTQGPQYFVGYTQTSPFNGPVFDAYVGAFPGELEVPFGTPNPACYVVTKHITTYSRLAGGGEPDASISVMDGVEYPHTGTTSAITANCLDFFVNSYVVGRHYTIPAVPYIDAVNHNPIVDSEHQATYYVDYSLGATRPVDAAYFARGFVFQNEYIIHSSENDGVYRKRPVYEYPPATPSKETYARQCDMTFGFYERGENLIPAYNVDYTYRDSAIWLTKDGEIPKRSKFGNFHLVEQNPANPPAATSDNPKQYDYIGRLIFDRASRSVGFKPA